MSPRTFCLGLMFCLIAGYNIQQISVLYLEGIEQIRVPEKLTQMDILITYIQSEFFCKI